MTAVDNATLLITPEEAARRLSIDRTKCYELIDIGIIPSVKIGRLRRVIAAELPSVVERLRQEDKHDQT
jgi:excisionase family DNA binding protein